MKTVFGIDANGENSPVDATKPVTGVSDRYGFVSTRNIIEVFEAKGWTVEQTVKSRVRDTAKDGYQRHLVTLKHPDYETVPGLTDDNKSAVRLCLFNSHDMSTSLMVSFGLFRGACLNLNLFGTTLRHFRAVHSKGIVKKVDQGLAYLTDGIPELFELINQLQSIQLNKNQRADFARRMINERLKNVSNILNVDYEVTERALRTEDKYQDAYTVFNRAQEYMIRGGIPYTYRRDMKDKVTGAVVATSIIHTHTRKVASIATQLRLSEALTKNILDITGVKVAA